MKAVGPVVTVCIVVFYIMSHTCSVSANFWLSAWSNDADNATVFLAQRDMRLGVYTALGLAQGSFVIIQFSLCQSGTVVTWRTVMWEFPWVNPTVDSSVLLWISHSTSPFVSSSYTVFTQALTMIIFQSSCELFWSYVSVGRGLKLPWYTAACPYCSV